MGFDNLVAVICCFMETVSKSNILGFSQIITSCEIIFECAIGFIK